MATSARFGATGGRGEAVSVRFEASSMLHLVDRMTGYFRGGAFQQALSEVHDDVAVVVQKGMVEELKRQVRKGGAYGHRPQRGTQYLEVSLLDERNREVTASGYWVLRPSWMDQSPAALYWRRIEEGDTKTFNSVVLFTTDFQRFVGPWTSGSTDGQSVARYQRSGGTTQLTSRKMRAGFPHMRMPQHRGVTVYDIGPFPAYQYTLGGQRAAEKARLGARYKTALSRIGLSISDVAR